MMSLVLLLLTPWLTPLSAPPGRTAEIWINGMENAQDFLNTLDVRLQREPDQLTIVHSSNPEEPFSLEQQCELVQSMLQRTLPQNVQLLSYIPLERGVWPQTFSCMKLWSGIKAPKALSLGLRTTLEFDTAVPDRPRHSDPFRLQVSALSFPLAYMEEKVIRKLVAKGVDAPSLMIYAQKSDEFFMTGQPADNWKKLSTCIKFNGDYKRLTIKIRPGACKSLRYSRIFKILTRHASALQTIVLDGSYRSAPDKRTTYDRTSYKHLVTHWCKRLQKLPQHCRQIIVSEDPEARTTTFSLFVPPAQEDNTVHDSPAASSVYDSAKRGSHTCKEDALRQCLQPGAPLPPSPSVIAVQ